MPVNEPMPAMDGEVLLHTPPVVASDSVVIDPSHTTGVPVIALGFALMVNVAVVMQPEPNEYVITGLPVAIAVTAPDGDTVARKGLLLVHVPPEGVPISEPVPPTQ